MAFPKRPRRSPANKIQWSAVLGALFLCALLRAETPEKAASAPVANSPEPVFPLKSEYFGNIDDSQEHAAYNYDKGLEATEIDFRAMADVIEALRASSAQHLLSSVRGDIGWANLLKHPERYRGEVVTFNGVLQDIHEISIGSTPIWKGETSNLMGHIVSFRAIEPPAAAIKRGRAVKLTGIFMQRYAYLNRLPGEKLTWAPLIYVKSVEPGNDSGSVTTQNGTSNMTAFVLSIFFGAIFVLYLAYRIQRMRQRISRGNHFTRLREANTNTQPGGLFPKPGTKRPGSIFPGPGKK